MGGLQSLGKNLYPALLGDFGGTATVVGDFSRVFALGLDSLILDVVGATLSWPSGSDGSAPVGGGPGIGGLRVFAA